MRRLFLFKTDSPLPKGLLESSLSGFRGDVEIHYHSALNGTIYASEDALAALSSLLPSFKEDSGVMMSILIAHDEGRLSQKLLNDVASYFPGQCLFVSDVLLKEISFGDFSSLPYLRELFKDVSRENLLTAIQYLKSGLSGKLAAEALYIHRNTMNYRMEAFLNQTGLDIRDYHDALILEIYVHFAMRDI